MRTITYTSQDKVRRVVMRERIGSDISDERFINASLAAPLAASEGLDKIDKLPNLIWGRIIEIGSYIQQIVSLEGDWGDIVLPQSDTDDDRHAFYRAIMESSGKYILTLQAAMKEVNTSPLNPPLPDKPD